MEAVVLEQLLETLPPELRVWVRERKPTTSAKAGQMAEDYLQATKAAQPFMKSEPPKRVEKPSTGVLCCHTCGEPGHFARDCKKGPKTGGGNTAGRGTSSQTDRENIRCYNCGRRGHVAMNCPSKVAMFCGQRRGWPDVTRCGSVEGHPVRVIVLDTGCSRTLVRQDLVPRRNRVGGEVSIRCAHRDFVSYELADIKLEMDGRRIQVQVGVAPNLPVPVLLGTDIPELAELLQSGCSGKQTKEALMVITRAKKRREELEAARQAAKVCSQA